MLNIRALIGSSTTLRHGSSTTLRHGSTWCHLAMYNSDMWHGEVHKRMGHVIPVNRQVIPVNRIETQCVSAWYTTERLPLFAILTSRCNHSPMNYRRYFCSEQKHTEHKLEVKDDRDSVEHSASGELEHGFAKHLTNDERSRNLLNDVISKGKVQEREYNVLDVIRELVDAGIGRNRIYRLVIDHVHLVREYSPDLWKTAVKGLQDSGFSNEAILPMITKNRNILHLTSMDVARVTYALRQVFVTDGRMRKVCAQLPILLTLSHEEIDAHFNKLSTMFTKNHLFQLLDKSPTMVLNDTAHITAKLDYVLMTLGVPEKHIAKTGLFSHSMEYIITRSEFLIKSGLYQKPDKHGHSRVDNALLSNILDSSDKEYCKRVAGCPLAEYRAYCDMFDLFDPRSPLCIQNEEHDDFESDSDSDSDSE